MKTATRLIVHRTPLWEKKPDGSTYMTPQARAVTPGKAPQLVHTYSLRPETEPQGSGVEVVIVFPSYRASPSPDTPPPVALIAPDAPQWAERVIAEAFDGLGRVLTREITA